MIEFVATFERNQMYTVLSDIHYQSTSGICQCKDKFCRGKDGYWDDGPLTK